MMRWWMLAVGVAWVLIAGACARAEAERRPNFVVILVDDLGWTDPAFMGSDYHETPAMDRLAREGVAFTSAYASAPNCAPSRAALLTGMYGPRTGMYTVGSTGRGDKTKRRLHTPLNQSGIFEVIETLPEALRPSGYRTGHIGKWHLGLNPRHRPRAQGFEHHVGDKAMGHPRSYFSPYGLHGLEDGPEGEHLTTRMTDEAIAFVRAHKEAPFFLYLAYFAVHGPIEAEADRIAHFEGKERGAHHANAAYAAMLASLDENIGRLLDELEELGVAERTFVVLTSDNGGADRFTSMAPLRGGKGDLYEGGVRVPMVIRWGGAVEAGRRVDEPVIGVDLYPTVLEIAGVAPARQPVDGVSLVPLLEGGGELEREAIFWHFPAYLESDREGETFRTTPCGAIRMGSWKLIEWFETGEVELYDLSADIGESRDLAEAAPGKREELLGALRAWRERVRAPVPKHPNPEYVAPEDRD